MCGTKKKERYENGAHHTAGRAGALTPGSSWRGLRPDKDAATRSSHIRVSPAHFWNGERQFHTKKKKKVTDKKSSWTMNSPVKRPNPANENFQAH